jgi:hypothetical protein
VATRLLPLLAVCAMAVTACDSEEQVEPENGDDLPVVLDPLDPGAEDVVTVRAEAVHKREIDGANYQFTLSGPTGAQCDDTLLAALGRGGTSDRAARRQGGRVIVQRLYPTRGRNPFEQEDDVSWCPGRYVGAVDYRIPGVNTEKRELSNGVPVYGRVVGRFSFEVHE